MVDLNQLGLNITYTSNRKRQNSVEGWGSLQTPFGVFPNTIKLKTTVEFVDTIFAGGNTLFNNLTNVEYQWFSLDYGIPVLEASGVLNAAGEPEIAQVTYIDSFRCVRPVALYTFSPLEPVYNFQTGVASVEFRNRSIRADSVFWNFGDGGFSVERNPTYNFRCPGLKEVQLIVYNNSFCNPPVADTLTLPIIIPDTTLVEACRGDSIFIGGIWEKTNGVYQATNNCEEPLFVNAQFVGPDTSVTVIDLGIFANQTNATYQWLDCNDNFAPVPGATIREFESPPPGSYAVEINVEGCMAISECVEFMTTSTSFSNSKGSYVISPNPVDEILHLNFRQMINNGWYQIYSSSGKLQKSGPLHQSRSFAIPFNAPKGIYFIQVRFEDQLIVQKFSH